MNNNTKVYLAVFLVRAIYAGLHITSKAAFNGGMSTYVFVFYRQVLATLFMAPIAFVLERQRAPPLPFRLFCKIFLLALFGVSATLIVYSVGLDYTSATLSSAIMNSMPVTTFIVAVSLRMETVKLKGLSGNMKVSGVLLCLAGILTMAFYRGPHLQPLSHHHLLGGGSSATNHPHAHSRKTWVLGTFLMTISNTTWSLWMVLQEPLLKEYPSKLLFTTLQSMFSAIQSFFVALAMERDFSRWKLGFDVSLASVAYCGIIVTGVSFYLQSWVIERKGPVFLAMSTPLTLIITVVCSSFLLGETVNLESILGGVLMAGGLYSVLWGQRKEQINNDTSKDVDRKASLDDVGRKVSSDAKENGTIEV